MAHRRALTALAAVLLLWACHRPAAAPPAGKTPEPAPPPAPAQHTRTVTLFFLSVSSGELAPVLAEMGASEDPAANARAVLELLLAGPKDPAYSPPLPPGSSIRGIYPTGEFLVADLALPPDAEPFEGTRNELDVAYAVANTVCLNVPEYKGVHLLFNGTDRSPFFTHLDLSRPLRPKL